MKLGTLKLWMDPESRSGPECMAVDEWLHSLSTHPILRVYRWQGEWGSLGYFDRLGQAQESYPEISQWVRRWTGGGTVDHRSDWTYTLILPFKAIGRERLGGAESYRFIHQALCKALEPEALGIRLSGGDGQTGAPTCFDNPVAHDLIDATGRKVAGAGQRRSRSGIMHQGSVGLPTATAAAFQSRAESLAEALSEGDWSTFERDVPLQIIQEAVRQRYGNPQWTQRRL